MRIFFGPSPLPIVGSTCVTRSNLGDSSSADMDLGLEFSCPSIFGRGIDFALLQSGRKYHISAVFSHGALRFPTAVAAHAVEPILCRSFHGLSLARRLSSLYSLMTMNSINRKGSI